MNIDPAPAESVAGNAKNRPEECRMKSYLFFWVPTYYRRFVRDYAKWLKGELGPMSWSSGSFRSIPEGSRVFVMRLGDEPKGIVASGWTASGWYERKNAEGKRENANDLTFDAFGHPDHPLLSLAALLQINKQKAGLWLSQGTVAVSDALTEKLEARWAKAVARTGLTPRRDAIDPGEVPARPYIEGATRRILVNAYERNNAARQACIDNYGPTCTVCGFDFIKRYGSIGRGFIHVHHLKQLSEIGRRYRLDPIQDLRPVCPNCHAMLHTRLPSYSIEELKAMLRR